VHREALAVGVRKSKHRNVCINIIWIYINFVLHDMFYCAVFNLCNFIMHVGQSKKAAVRQNTCNVYSRKKN
jgi:hypothetical protein